jgi:uncharacterized pyridoxamine 5'-phosphate oxidase family protein
MNTKNEFERIMESQREMALATSVNGECNVRIVNFFYDETSQTVFFATFEDNDKVREFEQNSNVAFTTIPHKDNEHVKAKGRINRSSSSIFDIKDSFISKIPSYKDTIEQVGEFLVVLEIKFNTAIVTLDLENIDTFSLV